MTTLHLFSSGTRRIGVYEGEIVYEESGDYKYQMVPLDVRKIVKHNSTEEQMEKFNIERWEEYVNATT